MEKKHKWHRYATFALSHYSHNNLVRYTHQKRSHFSFHKDGLGPIVDALNAGGTTIYSTGGTQAFIEGRGIPVERVEDLTSYPSILEGVLKHCTQSFWRHPSA